MEEKDNKNNETKEIKLGRSVVNDIAPREGEIDLVCVFENMWNKKGVYVWAILAFFIVGTMVGLLSSTLKSEKRADTAHAILSLDYEGSNELLAPDGSELDIGIISSAYIVNKALSGLTLSEEISADAVASSLSVERLLSDGTRQYIDLINSVVEKKPEGALEVLDMEYEYSNLILLSLNNSFDKGKKLASEELTALLDGIIDAYNDYLVKEYSKYQLPSSNLVQLDISSLDYDEAISTISDELTKLEKYCTKEIAKGILSYRSSDDGMRLLDASVLIRYYLDSDVSNFSAFVNENALTKDKGRTISRYEYSLNNYRYEYNALIENIQNNNETITNYKNDENTLFGQDGTAVTAGVTVTEHYNELVAKQLDYYDRKKNISVAIKRTEDVLGKLNASSNAALQNSVIDSELENIYESSIKLYELVFRISDEFFNSFSYTNAYTYRISAQYSNESLLFSTIASAVKIGVISCFLAILIWGLDALLEETKRGKDIYQNGGIFYE